MIREGDGLKKCLLMVMLGLFAAQQIQAQGMFGPFGPDFQVNSMTGGSPYSADVTGGEDGFVVVWSGLSDGFYSGVSGRRLAADGSPIGVDFQINTVTELSQFSSAAATAPDGRFAVTWASGQLQVAGQSNIAARVFDSAGNPFSPDEIRVNDFTAGKQSTPSVASASDGTFMVVWKSLIHGYPNYEIRARRLSAEGDLLGAEFQVNDATAGSQEYPDIAALAGGEFIVAWRDYLGAGVEITARRMTGDGVPLATDFQVNSYGTGFQGFPAVAPAPGGDFLVVWESFGSSAGDQDLTSVQARLFSSDGTPVGLDLQVNTYTSSQQFRPDVAATADGRFVVTWIDGAIFGGQDGDGYGIFGRMIEAGGTPVGDEFQVNAYTTSTQRIPAIARAGDRFVVVWQGAGPDAEGRQIFGRRLSTDLIFHDGFESGDLSGWSSSEP